MLGTDWVLDIVYFEGTRIIGASPDWSEGDGVPILDDPSDGHGTAVTGAVVNANPDVVIFFVEGFSDSAVLAAAAQPLVDIISTSFGAPGSLPVPGIDDATRVAVVDHGKIHTGAADNSPSPAIQDATAGPPWSIGIAGYAEGDDEQKETMSGSYPDIAADWTQNLPNHQDLDGYHDTSGTSFATPKTAGILSAAFRRSAPALTTLVLARRMIGTVHWSQACWMLSPSHSRTRTFAMHSTGQRGIHPPAHGTPFLVRIQSLQSPLAPKWVGAW